MGFLGKLGKLDGGAAAGGGGGAFSFFGNPRFCSGGTSIFGPKLGGKKIVAIRLSLSSTSDVKPCVA